MEKECGVKIIWPKFNGTEEDVPFKIRGSKSRCKDAIEMLRANLVSIMRSKFMSAYNYFFLFIIFFYMYAYICMIIMVSVSGVVIRMDV